MKSTASHAAAFILGVVVGILAATKGCPPIPAPAEHDPPPVTSPASTGAAK